MSSYKLVSISTTAFENRHVSYFSCARKAANQQEAANERTKHHQVSVWRCGVPPVRLRHPFGCAVSAAAKAAAAAAATAGSKGDRQISRWK